MSDVDYPGKGAAWADFLHHRARVLVEFRAEGKTPEDTARILSMDPGQVAAILDSYDPENSTGPAPWRRQRPTVTLYTQPAKEPSGAYEVGAPPCPKCGPYQSVTLTGGQNSMTATCGTCGGTQPATMHWTADATT